MENQRPAGHSRLGIASFALSLAMGAVLFQLVVILGVLESTTPGGLDEDSAVTIILGLLVIFSLFLDLVAFGLGIAGIFQHRRKKMFAILGAIFSGFTLLIVVALTVVGIVLG